METGLNELKELFGLKDRDLRTYSPLTLASVSYTHLTLPTTELV